MTYYRIKVQITNGGQACIRIESDDTDYGRILEQFVYFFPGCPDHPFLNLMTAFIPFDSIESIEIRPISEEEFNADE